MNLAIKYIVKNIVILLKKTSHGSVYPSVTVHFGVTALQGKHRCRRQEGKHWEAAAPSPPIRAEN